MKKLAVVFSVVLAANCTLFARPWADIRMAQPLLDVHWSPLQISVWPISLVPAVDAKDTSDIYGVNLNLTTLFHVQRNVYGLSCGLFQVFDEKHCGVMISAINGGVAHYGLAVGGFNSFFENNGVSIGIANDAINRNSSLNNGKFTRRSAPNFLQIGVLNFASEGMQIGLFNTAVAAENAKSLFQFGLLNHNPDGLLPWMPLFNFSISEKGK